MINEPLPMPNEIHQKFRDARSLCRHQPLSSVHPPAVSPGNSPKSSAQVETSVIQTVLQKSCGLKPKSLKERKSEIYSVRYKAGELAVVKIKAQQAGVSINSYIRATSLDTDYKQPLNPELQRALLATQRQLTGLGNNVNQITKYLHTGTATPDQAIALMDSISVPLIRALTALRSSLVQGEPQP